MSEICRNCRFWLENEFATYPKGECRRYPKAPRMRPEFGGPDIGQKPDRYVSSFEFPLMTPDEWCGEWKSPYQPEWLPGF